MPEGLSIVHSENKGKGWKANKSFAKGEVLFCERPLTLGLFTDQALCYCGCCFTNIQDLSPEVITSCNDCFSFSLCKACEGNEEAWNAHKTMCGYLKRYGSSNDEDESAYSRIFLHSLINPSFQLTKSTPAISESLHGTKEMILQLIVNENGINTEVSESIQHWASIIASKLASDEKFQEQFSGLKEIETLQTNQSLEQALEEFWKRLVYNWHAIPADNVDDDDIGYAVFPNACFFNHSCSPNVSWKIDREKGALFFATALRDIHEGEEVLISYFGDDPNVSTLRRKDYLKEYYQFECDCDRCKQQKDCYLCEAESKYLCSLCKNIKYCSKECQRKHWRAHKKECKK